MENQYNSIKLINRFIPYYAKYKNLFLSDMLAAILTVVAEISLPLILRSIINIATDDISKLTLEYILIITAIYIILKAVEVLSTFYMQKYGHIMGAKIEKDMRKEVFSHIQYLSDEFFSKNKIGQLLARVTTDLFDVTEFAHHCPEEFLVAIVKIVVTFVILISINVPMTLLMFSMIPLMLILTNKTRKQIRIEQMSQRHQIGEINSSIEDSLLGIKVIRSFSNEKIEIEKFEKGNSVFFRIKAKFYSQMAKFNAITKVFDALMHISVIVLGGIFLMSGKITSGDYILYSMFTTTLLSSIARIINFIDVFEKGITGIQRFFKIKDTVPKIIDSENGIELENVKGNIRFNNVQFSYNNSSDIEDKKLVLNNVNLYIEAGSKIALVGPSGGGKTTLTNLIPRFYDVDYGEITIDGIDIRDIKLKSLRNSVGIVQQDVYLFSGTIAQNISYGKLDASDEEIINACKMAGAMEFIDNLPNGIHTYVGERGVMLSGGQKQRISIARVFLKNPPILILDEATSSLDNKSEQIVQKSLQLLSKGRTTITIAHRLSTIVNADEIIVLTEKGIREKGTHKKLLEKKGEYYTLYNRVDNHIMG